MCRKEIYLIKYPETEAGIAGGKAGGRGREKIATDTMSFASDTAIRTGNTERTIRRHAKIGKELSDFDIIFSTFEISSAEALEILIEPNRSNKDFNFLSR